MSSARDAPALCTAGSVTRRANLTASEAVLSTLRSAEVRRGVREGRKRKIHMHAEPVMYALLREAVRLGRRRSLSTSTARCEYGVLSQLTHIKRQYVWLAALHGPTCVGHRRCQDESIDELAAYLGVGDVVATMTAKCDPAVESLYCLLHLHICPASYTLPDLPN